jgi:N-methylhydantoinase A
VLERERAGGETRVELSLDVRYYGQTPYLNLILDEVPRDRAAIDAIVERYGEAYEKEFGYRFDRDLATVEFVNARAAAIGVTRDAELQLSAQRNGRAEPRRSRPVFFEERNDFVDVPIFDRGSLGPGTGITGPAVIEQDDTTVLLPPGTKVEVDGYLNLLIDARGA